MCEASNVVDTRYLSGCQDIKPTAYILSWRKKNHKEPIQRVENSVYSYRSGGAPNFHGNTAQVVWTTTTLWRVL